jgi:hypothetical protein
VASRRAPGGFRAGPVSVAGVPHAARIKAHQCRDCPCMRAAYGSSFFSFPRVEVVRTGCSRIGRGGSFPRVARHLLRRQGRRSIGIGYVSCATM